MLKDFKSFALRPNVLDLAVAVVMGGAFVLVVTSLTNDVIMAAIGAFLGKPNFNELVWHTGEGIIRYGRLLTALVNFLIIAIAVYAVVRTAEKLRAAGEAKTTRECPFCLTHVPKAATRCGACTSHLNAIPA